MVLQQSGADVSAIGSCSLISFSYWGDRFSTYII